MNLIFGLLKVVKYTTIFYVMTNYIHEMIYNMKVEGKIKLIQIVIFLANTVLVIFLEDTFGSFAYLTYIISLIYIHVHLFKSSFIQSITRALISFAVFYISMQAAHSLVKTYNMITLESLILEENSLSYAIVSFIAMLVTVCIFFKYIKKHKENMAEYFTKLKRVDVILMCIILLSFSVMSITKFKFTCLYELYFLLTTLVMLVLVSKLLYYHTHAEDEMVQNKLYIKSLSDDVDNLRIIKHDYNNIIQSINGYLVTKQYDGLNSHMKHLTDESKKITALESINPAVINQPAIFGVIGEKYYSALDKKIDFNIDVATNISQICFDFCDLSRILGILLDNAIEASLMSDNKKMSIAFRHNSKRHADMIEIKNTIKPDLNIDVDKIFEKGQSSKKVKSGLGLWEVKKIISSKNNSQIYANVENNIFSQTIVIEQIA